MNSEPVVELPANPMSLAARMLHVFSVPGEVFAGLTRSRFAVSNWLVPALLSALIGVLCQWVIFAQPTIFQQIRDMQDRAIQQQVDQGKMSAEQAKAAQQAMSGDTMQTLMRVFGSVAAVGYAVVSPLWWALLAWAAGRVVFRTPVAYLRVLEVTGLASLISSLGGAVSTFLAVGTGSMLVGPHLGVLLRDLDLLNRAHLALCTVNLFGLWHLAVLTVGLAGWTGRKFPAALFVMAGIWIGFKGLAVVLGLGQWVL